MARPVLLLELLSDLLQAPDIPLQCSRVAPSDRPTHAILWVQQHILKILCILHDKSQRQFHIRHSDLRKQHPAGDERSEEEEGS